MPGVVLYVHPLTPQFLLCSFTTQRCVNEVCTNVNFGRINRDTSSLYIQVTWYVLLLVGYLRSCTI